MKKIKYKSEVVKKLFEERRNEILKKDFYTKLSDGYYDKVDVEYPSWKTKNTDPDYRNKINKYNEAMWKKRMEFKKDMIEYAEVTDNPKAEKCWNIAYEKGHSGGYNEVFCEFQTIVELIK